MNIGGIPNSNYVTESFTDHFWKIFISIEEKISYDVYSQSELLKLFPKICILNLYAVIDLLLCVL